MNLTPQDIDEIFSTVTDDQKKNTESDELTVDGEAFLLPSQRKKALDQNNKKKGKQKKRPPRQPRLTLEQILNDDNEFNDVFQFSSEQPSSNANGTESEKQNAANSSELNKKNESEQSIPQNKEISQINIQNQQQPQQQQFQPLQQQQPPQFQPPQPPQFQQQPSQLQFQQQPQFQPLQPQQIQQQPSQLQFQQQPLQQTQYQQQPQQFFQQHQINNIQPIAINSIESNLINYISTAVYSIRESFIDELKYALDNSKKEQSIIDSFLLSLPSEIEELVASEIQIVTESYNAKSKINTFTNFVDTQLEPLQHLLPRQKNQVVTTTVDNLQDEILNAKILMNEQYDTLLDEVQSENDILNSLREKSFIFEDRKRRDNSNSILMIEKESYKRRLKIEQDFCNFRLKRLKKMQSYYNESEFNSHKYPLSQTEVLLNKLSALARKVPQSKYKSSLSSLSALSQNFQCLTRDLHCLQKKIISETNLFVKNLSSNIENNNIDNFDYNLNSDNNLNNFNDYDDFCSNHSKRKNENQERKHKHSKKNEKQFHSSRSVSSKGSPESSMVSDIKEQLKELRKQRIQQNQIIQENQNLL